MRICLSWICLRKAAIFIFRTRFCLIQFAVLKIWGGWYSKFDVGSVHQWLISLLFVPSLVEFYVMRGIVEWSVVGCEKERVVNFSSGGVMNNFLD